MHRDYPANTLPYCRKRTNGIIILCIERTKTSYTHIILCTVHIWWEQLLCIWNVNKRYGFSFFNKTIIMPTCDLYISGLFNDIKPFVSFQFFILKFIALLTLLKTSYFMFNIYLYYFIFLHCPGWINNQSCPLP